jgi:hypothetical protein
MGASNASAPTAWQTNHAVRKAYQRVGLPLQIFCIFMLFINL